MAGLTLTAPVNKVPRKILRGSFSFIPLTSNFIASLLLRQY